MAPPQHGELRLASQIAVKFDPPSDVERIHLGLQFPLVARVAGADDIERHREPFTIENPNGTKKNRQRLDGLESPDEEKSQRRAWLYPGDCARRIARHVGAGGHDPNVDTPIDREDRIALAIRTGNHTCGPSEQSSDDEPEEDLRSEVLETRLRIRNAQQPTGRSCDIAHSRASTLRRTDDEVPIRNAVEDDQVERGQIAFVTSERGSRHCATSAILVRRDGRGRARIVEASRASTPQTAAG